MAQPMHHHHDTHFLGFVIDAPDHVKRNIWTVLLFIPTHLASCARISASILIYDRHHGIFFLFYCHLETTHFMDLYHQRETRGVTQHWVLASILRERKSVAIPPQLDYSRLGMDGWGK
jgi:hypothetical protein